MDGIGSHQSASALKEEWLTPPYILAALGTFDLDPCAPTTRPWEIARHYYTKADNGLAKPWATTEHLCGGKICLCSCHTSHAPDAIKRSQSQNSSHAEKREARAGIGVGASTASGQASVAESATGAASQTPGSSATAWSARIVTASKPGINDVPDAKKSRLQPTNISASATIDSSGVGAAHVSGATPEPECARSEATQKPLNASEPRIGDTRDRSKAERLNASALSSITIYVGSATPESRSLGMPPLGEPASPHGVPAVPTATPAVNLRRTTSSRSVRPIFLAPSHGTLFRPASPAILESGTGTPVSGSPTTSASVGPCATCKALGCQPSARPARVFCNPPYGGKEGAWLARCADHGNAIALTFARTETAAFHEHIWDKADALLFLKGRLHFHHANGQRAAANAGGPSVLVAYGAQNVSALRNSGLAGRLVLLH